MDSMKKKAKQTLASPSPTADQDGAGGDDRISALDDDLCELILRLANLNVRELVRTSVLSKRWRSFWKRFPVLDFFGWPELKSAGDVSQYISIVNDVLEQRAGATLEACVDEVKIPLLLDRSSLYCQRQPAMEAAEAWIRYAMDHQVKDLQLKLRLPPVFNRERTKLVMNLDKLLPSSPKLECMHLELSHIEVRLPRTIVFTLLRVLTLEFVELAADSGYLARLLSSLCCPILQKLRMMRINFAWTKELVLDAGELLELSMEEVYHMELLELRTPKLLYLEINKCEFIKSLRVSSPGLKEITYFGNTAFMHGPLPCVWRLKIDLFSHIEEGVDEDPKSNRICLMKHCSSSLRCLLVHLYVLQKEERQVDLIKDKMPQLPNIMSLLVSIDKHCERHSFGDGVASLLTKFKNLEYLSLELNDSPNIWFKRDEYYSEDDVDLAFTCNHPDHWKSSDISLANLCKAEFRGMTGTGCELRFLQFVLASATNLQSMTVSFNLYFIEQEEEEEEEEDNEEEEDDEEEEEEDDEEEEEEEEEEEDDEDEEEDEVQYCRIHYFLHTLLGHGTWTADENTDEDCDKLYKSKLYKWTPSPCTETDV